MKTIICTASENKYIELLYGLVCSIRNKPKGASVDIGLLDLELSEKNLSLISPLIDHIVKPGWDLDFTFDSAGGKNPWPGYKAMTARPFLRDHFPGYDTYIWIDADCWVQDWRTIEWLLDGSQGRSIAIVPELDRAYSQMYDSCETIGWLFENYNIAYGKRVAETLRCHPIINAGVFAMQADAPHWSYWAEAFQDGLNQTTDFALDQLSLNYVIYSRNLRRHFLPTICNWLVNKALPRYDLNSNLFVEAYLPHTPLGIIHLSGDSKSKDHILGLINDRRTISSKVTYKPDRLDRLERRP